METEPRRPFRPDPTSHGPREMVREFILAAREKHESESGDPAAASELPGDLAAAIALLRPPGPEHPRALVDVISSRRSTSLRASGPLPLDALAALLANAEPAHAGPLCPDPQLRALLFVVALEVGSVDGSSLDPGAYRYDDLEHRLLPIQPVDREQLRAEVLLQHDQGDAAALVFVVTPLARWLRAQGDRGYRGALMSVGWAVDSLYLSAEGLGLGLRYSATGGFALTRANATLKIDGYHFTTALAFALGTRPPTQSPAR